MDCSQAWTLKADLPGFLPTWHAQGRHSYNAATVYNLGYTDLTSSYFSAAFLLFDFGLFLNSSELWFSHL